MNKNKLAQVFHFDLFGRREEKYDFLLQHSIDNIQWSEKRISVQMNHTKSGFQFVIYFP